MAEEQPQEACNIEVWRTDSIVGLSFPPSAFQSATVEDGGSETVGDRDVHNLRLSWPQGYMSVDERAGRYHLHSLKFREAVTEQFLTDVLIPGLQQSTGEMSVSIGWSGDKGETRLSVFEGSVIHTSTQVGKDG